jgi:hypothetical protein
VRVLTDTVTQMLTGTLSPDGLRGIFTLYGIGFAAMAGLTAALYRHSARRDDLGEVRHGGQVAWTVVAAAGGLSVLLAQLPYPWLVIAPWTYALLPVAVPFALRRRRLASTAEPG